MVPVLAVYVHVRYPSSLIRKAGTPDKIYRRFVLRQDESLDPVHLVFPEHEFTRSFKSLSHIAFSRVILIQVITDCAAHHSAVCKIKERNPSGDLFTALNRYPERDERTCKKRFTVIREKLSLLGNREIRIRMRLRESLSLSLSVSIASISFLPRLSAN